jgi:N utilization substance protein B
MDVGGASLAEANDFALERLRNEFVQRGSRKASGSTAELICLEYITSSLGGMLSLANRHLKNAILLVLETAFSSAPYWQEVCFEKVFKARFKGHKLQPARLLPVGVVQSAGTFAIEVANLTDSEASWVSTFARNLDIQLPLLLGVEMRKTAREAVAALQSQLPESTIPWNSAAEQLLLDERNRYNKVACDRWHKVFQIVHKQTADWLTVGCFTVRLVSLTDQHHHEIDALLKDIAVGWKLDRQVAVDRNIIRLAAVEMLYITDIPFTASINEAVELAKTYSTAESSKFVNGVLGALASQIGAKQAVDDRLLGLEVQLEHEIDVVDGFELLGIGDLEVSVGASKVPSGTRAVPEIAKFGERA